MEYLLMCLIVNRDSEFALQLNLQHTQYLMLMLKLKLRMMMAMDQKGRSFWGPGPRQCRLTAQIQ